jgi:predicted Zn-dependent peptidase
MVEANGGYLNGSTHPDYTDYFEVLPSNKLPVALWLEADRMRGLAINEENLANQKEAVKEERRLRLDNQPYVTAIVDLWPRLLFRNWTNFHSLIGSFEDLDAATVDDVARFFKTYYAPNNAVLVLAGDIDLEESKGLIEAYFGDIEPQPTPPRPATAEPAPDGERSAVYQDPRARIPALILGFPGPRRRSADYYALSVVDVILTAGQSSRFQQNLVKGRRSVIQYEANLGWPFASASDYLEPGAYSIFLLHHPNFRTREVLEHVTEELSRIQRDGPSREELERARTFLRAEHIKQVQSNIGRAQLLGRHELLDGDAGLLNTELDRFLEVTGEQIRSAARRYFDAKVGAVLEIVPGRCEGDPR